MGADGLRVNQFYPGAVSNQSLALTLLTADDAESQSIAAILQNSLDDCGIGLEISAGPAEQVFASGPGGAVFGRQFELAQFAWPYGSQPACYLYLSEAIPGQDLTVFNYGWGGWNISGWSDAAYDAACQQAQASLPGEAGYGDAERQAQAIFAEQLPALPLFQRFALVAARADFCGAASDPGSQLVQNLEFYGYGEWCN
jgi:peptide/nickel transport system substrate-binding protein